MLCSDGPPCLRAGTISQRVCRDKRAGGLRIISLGALDQAITTGIRANNPLKCKSFNIKRTEYGSHVKIQLRYVFNAIKRYIINQRSPSHLQGCSLSSLLPFHLLLPNWTVFLGRSCFASGIARGPWKSRIRFRVQAALVSEISRGALGQVCFAECSLATTITKKGKLGCVSCTYLRQLRTHTMGSSIEHEPFLLFPIHQ